jgi:hypothetical protein
MLNPKLIRFTSTIVFICLLFIVPTCIKQNKIKQQTNNLVIEALSSNLKTYINKEGKEVAQKNIISLGYKQLKKLRLQDSSEIAQLRRIIKKNTISATNLRTHTSGTLTAATKIKIDSNTTIIIDNNHPPDSCCDNCLPIWPEYFQTVSDEWSTMDVTANIDSISVKYNVINEFDITQSTEKQGKWPFRKKVPVITVVSKNPNTTTKGLSSFVVPAPSKAKAITTGSTISFILGAIVAFFIFK